MESEKVKKPLFKRILDITFAVVIVLLAVLIVLSLYSKKTGRDFLSYKIMWVLTASMEDTIPEQSYILTKKTDAKEIRENDIITFRFDVDGDGIKNELNTHRVVGIIGDNEKFITKGDNNLNSDGEPVSAEDVVAKYVCNLSLLTFFGRLYATPTGIVMTLIVIMAVMLFSSYFTKKKDVKDGDQTDSESEKQAEIDRLVAEEIARLELEDKQKQKNDSK